MAKSNTVRAATRIARTAGETPALRSRTCNGKNTRIPSRSVRLSYWAFPTSDMRSFARFLAILTMAALLAPSVRWTSPYATADACGCPPGACMCVGHQHGSGRLPSCCMGTSAPCGMQSPDSYISSIVSSLSYLATEHTWRIPIAVWGYCRHAADLSLLPSHARVPDQPPRFAL